MSGNVSGPEPRDDQQEQSPRSGALARLASWLLRLLLIALVGVFLGTGLYFGVPALVRAAVEPVEQNRARIEQLEADQERAERQQARERSEIAADLADLQGRVERLNGRLGEVEARADSLQQELQEVERQAAELDVLAEELRLLEADLQALEDEQDELEQTQEGSRRLLERLAVEVHSLRAIQMINTARAVLAEDDFELAQRWTERARSELLAARSLGAADPGLAAVVDRLELAQAAVEDSPDAADRDLRTALELLLAQPPFSPTITPQLTPQADRGVDG